VGARASISAVTTVAFIVFALVAAVDWIAVGIGDRRVEWVAKPLATLALVVVAASADGPYGGRQWWFVAALVLSLAGDVFLMLPRDLFVPGLAAFLVAHLAYVVGFWVDDAPHGVPLVLAVVLVGAVVAVLARRILAGLRDSGQQALVPPVTIYMGVLAVMAVSATGAGPAVAVFGAWWFLASDGLLAWNRFVQPVPYAPVAIMVTYHLAQAGLALSLV
jgi:uncharacterized membrane protein YhhN